jgi:hypothetical protein
MLGLIGIKEPFSLFSIGQLLEKKRAKVTQIKHASITSILLCKSNVILIFNIDCINICVF